MINYKIGDIFYDDKEYSARADFCNKNNLMIVEIEPDENGRRFQIVEPPQPTQKELDEQEVAKLKRQLEATDYVANKLAEATAKYFATGDKTELEQLTEKYSETMAQRQQWRDRVDELQNNLENMS